MLSCRDSATKPLSRIGGYGRNEIRESNNTVYILDHLCVCIGYIVGKISYIWSIRDNEFNLPQYNINLHEDGAPFPHLLTYNSIF